MGEPGREDRGTNGLITSIAHTIARGKPAEYGQEIVKRRYRLTAAKVSLKHKIVLDLGCGNGAQTNEFVNSGCRVIAVDVDHDGLQVFLKYVQAHDIDSVLLVQYDGSHLPIATGTIDLVISYEVIEHVLDESRTFHEIHRVLRPGGEMILSVPNKGWIFETHGACLPLLPWNRVPFFSWLPHKMHRRFAKARIYRKRDIIRLLRSHAFEVLNSEYITAPMDVVKTLWIKKALRSTIFSGDTTRWTFLSTSILVHCARA